MPKPILIGFPRCPYVRRSELILREKNVDYEIKNIDMSNRPQWFIDISPLGKVPLLQIGDEVLFESGVINEYLDEVYGESIIDDFANWHFKVVKEWVIKKHSGEWVSSFSTLKEMPYRTRIRC